MSGQPGQVNCVCELNLPVRSMYTTCTVFTCFRYMNMTTNICMYLDAEKQDSTPSDTDVGTSHIT